MTDLDDRELLTRYARSGSEEAFAVLVQRYVNSVYSAAYRQMSDSHQAEEVTQAVFLLLARKAGSFGRGVILGGWLHRAARFIAADMRRGARRRLERETRAMEQSSANSESSSWEHLAPLLDEGLDSLKDQDRHVLLLRFFRQLELRDVAAELDITEDAAQKRVSRALARLRDFYGRRGAVVSVSALGGVLAAEVVQAAPLALGPAIVSAAATSVVAGSSMLSLTSIMNLMLSTKMKSAALALALTALTATTVTQRVGARHLREENRLLQQETRELESRLTASRSLPDPAVGGGEDLDLLRRQAAEVHQLRGELGSLQQLLRALAETGQLPSNQRSTGADEPNDPAVADLGPMERWQLAKDLLRDRRPGDALEHFLWCFDEGMAKDPAFSGVRLSFMLTDLADLAQSYPPAFQALRERRDALAAKLHSEAAGTLQTLELITLNEKLGEPELNLTLADQLEHGSPARTAIFRGLAESLLAEQRYGDLLRIGDPLALYADQEERLSISLTTLQGRPAAETASAGLARNLSRLGLNGFEALAGAGDTARALDLADRLLARDGSAEMRRQLIQRAHRSGNTDLVRALGQEQPLQRTVSKVSG